MALIAIELPEELRDLFKAKCARRGFSMSDKVRQYIEEYIEGDVL